MPSDLDFQNTVLRERVKLNDVARFAENQTYSGLLCGNCADNFSDPSAFLFSRLENTAEACLRNIVRQRQIVCSGGQ